jgi:cell division protease FtsH
MVTKWGMSEVLGPLTYGDEQEQVFLGREIAQHRDYSEETARLIDSEVKKIVTFAFDRACSILKDNDEVLHRLAEALLEREILDREEIALLLKGEELPAMEEIDKPAESRQRHEPEPVEAPPGKPVPTGVGEKLAEAAERANGRHAGEPSASREPAARAEDGAPGEA